jgi:hypothetical protein
MLFKHHLAVKVRTRLKTESRRISRLKYRVGSIQPIQENYKPGKAVDHVKIGMRFEQRLGDMTEKQARAEGFSSLEEFRKEWEVITKQPWNPDQVVTAYGFDYLPPGSRTGTLLSAGELQQS